MADASHRSPLDLLNLPFNNSLWPILNCHNASRARVIRDQFLLDCTPSLIHRRYLAHVSISLTPKSSENTQPCSSHAAHLFRESSGLSVYYLRAYRIQPNLPTTVAFDWPRKFIYSWKSTMRCKLLKLHILIRFTNGTYPFPFIPHSF